MKTKVVFCCAKEIQETPVCIYGVAKGNYYAVWTTKKGREVVARCGQRMPGPHDVLQADEKLAIRRENGETFIISS